MAAVMAARLLLWTGWQPPLMADSQPATPPDHAEKTARSVELFKSQVRGILERNGLQCHVGAKVRSELNLSTPEGLLKGAAHGPAVIGGDAQKSLLFRLITHRAEPLMPLEAARLLEEAIQSVSQWIDLAYAWPLIEAAERRVSIKLHATILHLLGMDHERLSYRYNGRDFRLTDVAGHVIREIMV